MKLLALGKWHLSLGTGVVVVRMLHGALGRGSYCGSGRCRARGTELEGKEEKRGITGRRMGVEEGPMT